MKKIIYEFSTKKKSDGTVVAENGYIYTPKTSFKGGEITWAADKYKQPNK